MITPGTPMDHHDKMRIRAAAFRAIRLYPGPIGLIVSRELLAWEEFGYRLGAAGMIMTAVKEILKAPLASETQQHGGAN